MKGFENHLHPDTDEFGERTGYVRVVWVDDDGSVRFTVRGGHVATDHPAAAGQCPGYPACPYGN